MRVRWQDALITFAQAGFALALIPAVGSPEKPPIETSLITATLLLLMVIALSSLRFWWSAFTCAAVMIFWLTLAAQVLAR